MKKWLLLCSFICTLVSCGKLGKLTQEKNTHPVDSVTTQKKLTDEEQLIDWLDQLKKDWGGKKYKEVNKGTYSIDVPFKEEEDGTKRYQWVYISLGKNVADKKDDIWDIRSMACELNNKHLDILELLNDAKYGFYSMICIREKSEDQKQNAVYVQAGPLVKHCTTYEMFKFIVFEVAANADFLDGKYNQGEDLE
jgi:hypothetical protein